MVKWPISQNILFISDEVAYSVIDVKLNGVWLHMRVGLVMNSLDLVTRNVVRLCASVCDTGLNLAGNWLSTVELVEKLQSVILSFCTSWMERRKQYKINCGARRTSSVITSLFFCFQYQVTLLELRRLLNQQDSYSAECNTSAAG